jgi:hypothetical protein
MIMMRRKRALKLLHRDGGDELVEQLGALLLDCELRLALAREKINLGSLTKKFLTIYHEQLKKRAPIARSSHRTASATLCSQNMVQKS